MSQSASNSSSSSKTGQCVIKADLLIIILTAHNVPIKFADHFTKIVSNINASILRFCYSLRAHLVLAKGSHRARRH